MRVVPTLAAGVVLGLLGVTGVVASPVPLPGIVGSDTEWDPSTRHWDHHFHSHQRSRSAPQLSEIERYGHTSVLRARPFAHRPAWNSGAPAAQRY